MTAKKKPEMSEEEKFEEFVLENEERIMEILMEGKSQITTKIEAKKTEGKEFVKGMIEAMMNRDVQEHFMSMGIEFIMGVSAFIKAMPLPEEFKPFVDAVSEQKDAIGDLMCRNNPNCAAAPAKKTTAKKKTASTSSIEKIELK